MTTNMIGVTEGSYSDYRIRGLFVRKEDAEQAVAIGFGDSVEEFLVFDNGELPEKFIYWVANQYVADGSTLETWSHHFWSTDNPNLPPIRPEVQTHERRSGLNVSAFGRDEESVRKAVADRIAEIRAGLAGIT